MYHMESIDIRPADPEFAYMDRASLCSNNMFNTANFYIRNLMTGLAKQPDERTPNENFVISSVNDAIPDINKLLMDKYERKVQKIINDKQLSGRDKTAKADKVRCRQFEPLTKEKWFAGYALLDAVFRYSGNEDYASFHSHVIQAAIRACTEAWTSYFELIKRETTEGGNSPHIPGYRRSGGRSTAIFSNIACKISHGLLVFPFMDEDGKKKRVSINVSRLPHASKDKLIEVRAVPCYGLFQIQIITDDGISESDILPPESDVIKEDGIPSGVMMLDPGVDSFAAITDNKGNVPIVIRGGAVKSRNRWFNKKMAELRSALTRGHDPETYHPPATRRMQCLSRKRDAFLTDTFYKMAHYIFRLMKERDLAYLIVGHNAGQKQNSNMGKRNNQTFVSIPYARFNSILMSVARQYGIRVILQEESYTSKACFAAKDRIPVYGDEDAKDMSFSGKRVSRGLYRQNDGRVMNADVNGSLNIGRKYDERIFPKDLNTDLVYQTVIPMRYNDIIRESMRYHKHVSPVKRGSGRSVRPVSGQSARSPHFKASA